MGINGAKGNVIGRWDKPNPAQTNAMAQTEINHFGLRHQ